MGGQVGQESYELLPSERLSECARVFRGIRRAQATGVVIALAALVVLAVSGTNLEALFAGPAWLEAVQIAGLISLMSAAAFVGAQLGVRRVLAKRTAERLPVTGVALVILLALVGTVMLTGLWGAVAVTGSLMVLPVFMIAWALLLTTASGSAVKEYPPADDALLRRRLLRFARDAGVQAVDVRIRPYRSRSTTDRAPEVVLRGTAISGAVIEIPQELLDERASVMEAQLARQILRLAGHTDQREQLVTGVIGVITVGLIAVLLQDALVRAAGVTTVTAPGFLPMIAVVLLVARRVTLMASAPWRRRVQRREVRNLLDLTRDPDGFVEWLRRDVERFYADPAPVGLSRLFSVVGLDRRLAVADALSVVAAWRSSRRVCLLFTDVVGSTVNLNRLGDEGWYELLCEHDEIVRRITAEFNGVEIDNAGDGFLLSFQDTGHAVLAAIEMQRQLSEIEVAPGEELQVRMGLHVGDVIRRGRQVAGREVHLAARVGAAATGGEILVSSDAHAELQSVHRFRFGDVRTISAKGFEGDHAVFPVSWRRAEEDLVSASAPPSPLTP